MAKSLDVGGDNHPNISWYMGPVLWREIKEILSEEAPLRLRGEGHRPFHVECQGREEAQYKPLIQRKGSEQLEKGNQRDRRMQRNSKSGLG